MQEDNSVWLLFSDYTGLKFNFARLYYGKEGRGEGRKRAGGGEEGAQGHPIHLLSLFRCTFIQAEIFERMISFKIFNLFPKLKCLQI